MKTYTQIIYTLLIIIIVILIGCHPKKDCTHYFLYQGVIKSDNILLKDSLVIRFDNLGDIIFNIQKRRLLETSLVDSLGNYKVYGNFYTVCQSDNNIFNENDSLSFEIVRKGQIIKTGKFCIKKLNRKYTDSNYFTTINLPVIITE